MFESISGVEIPVVSGAIELCLDRACPLLEGHGRTRRSRTE